MKCEEKRKEWNGWQIWIKIIQKWNGSAHKYRDFEGHYERNHYLKAFLRTTYHIIESKKSFFSKAKILPKIYLLKYSFKLKRFLISKATGFSQFHKWFIFFAFCNFILHPFRWKWIITWWKYFFLFLSV